MVINKNSWHYKLYLFKYNFLSGYPPQQTNLCSYCQNIAALLPIGLIMLVAVFIFGSLEILLNLFSLPAGIYFLMTKHGPITVRYYNGLKAGKYTLLPWHVLVPAGVILALLLHNVISIVIGGYVSLVLVFVYLNYSSNKPAKEIQPSLLTSWWRAKKEGVCPLVEFEE